MKTRAEMYLANYESHTETQLQQWFSGISKTTPQVCKGELIWFLRETHKSTC
jgi:hypothetical protein